MTAAKTVSESATTTSIRTLPQDANSMGNVYGGVIMRLIDNVASMAAARHAGAEAVTASIDRMDFLGPIFVGEIVTLKASVNLVGRSSMEVGVRVEAENPLEGTRRHAVSAYLTFVALGKDRKSIRVPELLLENDEQKRRNRAASARRRLRLAERGRESAERGV